MKNEGGEREDERREMLEEREERGKGGRELENEDGGKGLEDDVDSVWDDEREERCTVHKERNLGESEEAMQEENKAEYNDKEHDKTAAEDEAKRKATWPRGSCAAGGRRTARKRTARDGTHTCAKRRSRGAS